LSLLDLFESPKPIIGMIHLMPLPGSPLFKGDFDEILDQALRDARALEEGGVDGVIVENLGDKPYPRTAGRITVAAMAVIVREVVKEIGIPVGVNVLRNDGLASVAIAKVTGASFIRVNVFIDTVISESGILDPIAPRLLRYRKLIMADNVKIFADVCCKHSLPLSYMRREALIGHYVKEAFERGLADAVIISGPRTGQPPNEKELIIARRSSQGRPILIGSGLKPENISLLKWADGAIVGTYFKKDGRVENPVDVNRVKKFMRVIKSSFSM